MPQPGHQLPPENRVSSRLIFTNDSEIHIWSFHYPESSSNQDMIRQWLSGDELDRAGRFHTLELTERFIHKRAFLRKTLARYLNIHPKQVEFAYGPFGKPEVKQPASPQLLRFSLSHSGSLAMCAVSLNREIGLDLEQLRSLEDMQDIVEHFFAPLEIVRFHNLPADERTRAFFKYWTAKEAFLKATGEGLSRPLDSFIVSVPGEEGSAINIVGDDDASCQWRLWQVPVGEGFAAALAAQGTGDISFVNNIAPNLANGCNPATG
jgi:4'-phosphopantetheinyl transferase